MKKIAITQRLIKNGSYPETRECLDIHYAMLVREAGFLPVVLPYEVDFKDYFSAFDICGVLLTGGNDLYLCNKNTISKQRDAFEVSLINYAIKKRIPIFGICRGLQIIAVYFGSTFMQVEGQIAVRSDLRFNESSKYIEKLLPLKKVNSYHNFSVKKLGRGLLASATNPSGIIKAIEHKKHRIFAQMWHSERENPFNKKEIELISYFFNVG
jgi:N5-(cytidine 5'-diphosphoramidyl)-L-glutamine hydrolase